MITEFENQRKNIHPPETTAVDIYPVKAMPTRCKFSSDQQWLIAGLKSTLICAQNGTNLIPIDVNDTLAIEMGLYRAWNDENLRQYHITQTPRTLPKITQTLSGMNADPDLVIYRIAHDSLPETDGLLTLECQFKGQTLIPWLYYENIHPESQGKHLMTNALSVLIQGLQAITLDYGFNIPEVLTSVSNRNMGSMRVLANNGFVIDNSRETSPSPINAGGTSIPVILKLQP